MTISNSSINVSFDVEIIPFKKEPDTEDIKPQNQPDGDE